MLLLLLFIQDKIVTRKISDQILRWNFNPYSVRGKICKFFRIKLPEKCTIWKWGVNEFLVCGEKKKRGGGQKRKQLTNKKQQKQTYDSPNWTACQCRPYFFYIISCENTVKIICLQNTVFCFYKTLIAEITARNIL